MDHSQKQDTRRRRFLIIALVLLLFASVLLYMLGGNILSTAPQSARDIPLSPLPPPPPCNTAGLGNTQNEYYLDEYNMGKSSGVFRFDYYTDTAPDAITVYCGSKAEVQSGSAASLFHYNDATGDITKTERIRFSGCSVITVEVKGSGKWEYTVHCPD